MSIPQSLQSNAAKLAPEISFDRWRAVKLVCCDVDGTLTDGSLCFDENGQLLQTYFVRDGFALVAARRAGLLIAWISGRASKVAEKRFAELGLNPELCLLDCSDKATAIKNLQQKYSLTPDECCFIGDDIPDLAGYSVCGIRVAVADAVPVVAERANYITQHPGGRGAVREVIDHILNAQGYYEKLLSMYELADKGAVDDEASDDMQR